MRERRWTLIGIAAVAAMIAVGCGSDGGSSESGSGSTGSMPTGDPIVIGMDVDSTGPGASYSIPARDTMLDAVDEINNNGGILGRPVQVITENDESDPTRTPSVVRKLVEDGADVLIMQTGGSAVAQGKAAIQEAGIPTIAPTSLTTSVAEPPDADFTYILANPISDFVTIFCDGWAKAGIESVAVISDESPTISGLNKLLLPGLGECVDIVAEESAPVDAADVNAQVARVGDAGADAVLVSSVGGGFEVLVQNTLSQQLPDMQRFSLAAIGNQPSTWELANPGALEGLVFMGSLNPDNELTNELQSFLEERRGDDWTMTAYDAQAYDAIQILKLAIEKAGVTDHKAVNEALQGISNYEAHFGQPGFTLSYSPTKHVGTDGLCGLSLITFNGDNQPGDPWDVYQPTC